MTISNIVCTNCRFKTVYHDDITTGYGKNADGQIFCFDCCGKEDAQTMIKNGQYTLYYVNGKVTNWPGTLSFNVYGVRKSRHNFGGNRFDFWFNFDNSVWHGYQIGNFNEIAHVRRTKEVA
jgi:hypothetical protein